MQGRSSKRFRRCAALAVIMMTLAGCAAGSAEDAFLAQTRLKWADAKDTPVADEHEKQGFRLLRLVMEGYFSDKPKDVLGKRIMAASFPLLAQIKEAEIRAFAGVYHLPGALVEKAFWLSLSETLSAWISLDQSSDKSQDPYRPILNQWLNVSGPLADPSADTPDKPADEGTLRNIAQAYGLPLGFIRFLASGMEIGGNAAVSQPARTAQSNPGLTTPGPSPANAQMGSQASPNPQPDGAGHKDQTPGAQDNGAGSPQKRR